MIPVRARGGFATPAACWMAIDAIATARVVLAARAGYGLTVPLTVRTRAILGAPEKVARIAALPTNRAYTTVSAYHIHVHALYCYHLLWLQRTKPSRCEAQGFRGTVPHTCTAADLAP